MVDDLPDWKGKLFTFPTNESDVSYGLARIWDPSITEPEEESFIELLNRLLREGEESYNRIARTVLSTNLIDFNFKDDEISLDSKDGFWGLPHLDWEFRDAMREIYLEARSPIIDLSEEIEDFLREKGPEALKEEPTETFTHKRMHSLLGDFPDCFRRRYDEVGPKKVLVYSFGGLVETLEKGESAESAGSSGGIVVVSKPSGPVFDEQGQRILVRRSGKGLLEHVSQSADADSIGNTVELGCNSYDADGERLIISIDNRKRTLCIEDDGNGMDLDGLDMLLLSGDSEKKGGRSPKHNRPQLGRFGLGTINLRNLGDKYVLTTSREGEKKGILLTERFDGPLREGKKVPHKIIDVPEDQHGTRIYVEGLRKGIDLRELREQIQWEMPIDAPRFEVVVNGVKIELPKIEGLASFHYTLRGEHMGDVEAMIYVMGRKHARAGMNVRVFGRAIGKPSDLIDYGSRKLTFKERILGILRADGLDDAINLRRRGFDENHPAYQELQTAMDPILTEVVNHARIYVQRSPAQKIHDAEPKILDSVRQSLSGARLISREATVELADPSEIADFEDDIPGIVTEEGNVVLNSGHSSLRIVPKMTPVTRRLMLLHAAASAIATKRARSPGRKVYFREHEQVWDRLQPNEASLDSRPDDDGLLHPNRLFSNAEVAEIMEMDVTDIRYLRNRGVLKLTRAKIPGSEVSETRNLLGPHTVALSSIVKDYLMETSANFSSILERLETRLGEAGDSIAPFFVDVSPDRRSDPCYFTLPICVEPFAALFDSSAFKGKGRKSPETVFRELSAKRYTAKQLSDVVALKQGEIEKIIERASGNGFVIKSRRGGGRGGGSTNYAFGDFIGAYVHLERGEAA